jgi:hypothetical protein
MKIAKARISLLATTALVLALAGAASAKTKESDIWTGYMATGPTFTRTSLAWRQPTVQCTVPKAQVSIWVGFGGGGTLQQDGTIAVCDGLGSPKFYKMFWEMFRSPPPSSGAEPIVVSPGDEIEASVEYHAKDDTVTLEVKDKTSGQDMKTVQPCHGGCPRANTNWIVEAPGGGKYPLANFGTFKLKHAEGRGDHDGSAGPDLDYSGFTMMRKSVTMATCDKLKPDDDGRGRSFTCTWEAAQ